MSYPFQGIQWRSEDDYHPNITKAALAEFISAIIFVFAGEGSVIAFSKLTNDASTTPAGLVAEALAHGIALFVAVAVASNNSEGHVNPAVTFGQLVGGHISLLKGIVYWIAQMLGATVACGLLKYTTNGMSIGVFSLSSGVGVGNALVLEIVMTFGLVYTVYATAPSPPGRHRHSASCTRCTPRRHRPLGAIDPGRHRTLGAIAPICIGFIVGANILAGGAFDGACMNPARAFGPALVSWTWKNHWIFWVGPLIGGGLAGAIFQLFFTEPKRPYDPLPESASDIN